MNEEKALKAVATIATEIVEALIKDEQEGYDLSAGMFGVEFSKWVYQTAKILDEAQEAVQVLNLISELTLNECSGVEIINPNPEFNGSNYMIHVTGGWVNIVHSYPFTGDTLLECLQNATKMKANSLARAKLNNRYKT